MSKTLKKHGNSHALVIDKPLMDVLGIDETTELKLTVSGSNLIVSPANVGVGEEELAPIVKNIREKYGKVLENLAK